MKLVLGLFLNMVILGCGIISAFFDYPERYIERAVDDSELVGEWNITSESETDIEKFLENYPSIGSNAPWRKITLFYDGTCHVELEMDWLPNESDYLPDQNDTFTTTSIPCNWENTENWGLDNKDVPVVEFTFDQPNYRFSTYLFIYEENGKLILWDFIGDPDDFFPQDFEKTPME